MTSRPPRRRAGCPQALWASLAIALGWWLVAAAGAAAQPAVRCDGGLWEVAAADPAEHRLACEGLQAAAEFLGACGVIPPLEGTLPTRVRLVDDLPDSCGRPIHGRFDADSDEILLGRPAHCATIEGKGNIFGLLPAETAFRSLATHEATHALLYSAGLGLERHLTHEYIATVVQFSALPAEDRETLVAAAGTTPAVHLSQINLFLYAMAPERFRAKVWMHFEAQPDGCAWLRDLVGGAARLPELPEL